MTAEQYQQLVVDVDIHQLYHDDVIHTKTITMWLFNTISNISHIL